MNQDQNHTISSWPALLRRGPMETLATIIIALGVFMLMQPFWLTLYTYSPATTLAGTVMYIIVTKFPK